jgi:peptide/nickel transport system substrate-binding protein
MDASQLVQAQLKDVGIDVKIESYEWGALMEAITDAQHDMSLMGYTYDDPDVLHLFLHSSQIGSGINWTHWKDEKLDELLDKGRTTTDAEERKAVYHELQRYIIDKAVWAPIYTNKVFMAVSPKVKGVFMHPIGGLDLRDAWIDQEQ